LLHHFEGLRSLPRKFKRVFLEMLFWSSNAMDDEQALLRVSITIDQNFGPYP